MLEEHKSGAAALEKALDLWIRVLANPDRPLRELAAELAIPPSTSYRLMSVFESRGLVARIGRGRYGAGAVVGQMAGITDRNALLVTVSRPVLRRLAAQIGRTVHLGVLQDDMVTYLVKEGRQAQDLFTQEGMQLEAYGSGIGKILLAHLEATKLNDYLSSGEFVELTNNTITSPNAIRAELDRVQSIGYALDKAEVAENLYCAAVPVRDSRGQVVAAVSASATDTPSDDPAVIHALTSCADHISARLALFGDFELLPSAGRE